MSPVASLGESPAPAGAPPSTEPPGSGVAGWSVASALPFDAESAPLEESPDAEDEPPDESPDEEAEPSDDAELAPLEESADEEVESFEESLVGAELEPSDDPPDEAEPLEGSFAEL